MNKAYSICMKAENEAEVNLYGEVVNTVPIDWWTGKPIDGLFIALDEFLKDLDRLKTMQKVTFRINSVGGDADAGVAIYNRIKDLKGETVTIVDGLAASSASIIAQAGDKRIMNIGTQMMIHCASTINPMYFRLSTVLDYMNGTELKKEQKTCQKAFQDAIKCVENTDKSISSIYAEKTGSSTEDVLSEMKEVKWMTAEEAVEEGYADEVAGADTPEAEATEGVKDRITVNGITHRLHNIPMPSMKMILQKKTADTTDDIDVTKNEEGVKKMDLKELKEKHAELCDEFRNEVKDEIRAEVLKENQANVDEVVAKALQEDRERMKDIDSIANQVGDPGLIAKAKYDEPMTAEQLALKAMQMQAASGSAFLQSRNEEVKNSGTEKITPAPVSGTEEDTRMKDIMDSAALIAGEDWKGGK